MKSSRTPASLLRSANALYICASCTSTMTSTSRRAFASSARRSAAPPPPPASGYARLSNRRLISLSGPDTVHFLQGVITADIAPSAIPRTSGFYAGFLNAKGRVVNDVFIYPDIHGLVEQSGKFKDTDGKRGERWIVEVDAQEVEQLYKHLRRYKLRAKLDLRVLAEEEIGVWHAWRDTLIDGEKGWTAHTMSSTEGAKDQGLITLADTRAPGMGKRILIAGSRLSESLVEGSEESTLDAYTIRRYLRGVPEGQGEILKETALPQESSIDYMGGISYRKGCYVGQELTIRTHHTGVVRKRILPIMLYPAGEAAPEKLEYRQDAGVGIPTLESKMERVNQMTAGESEAKQFPTLEAKRAWIMEKTEGTGDVVLDKSEHRKKEKRARGLGKFLTGIGNVGLGICRLEAAQDGFPYEVKCEVEGVEKSVGVKAFVPSWHLKDKE